MSWSIENIKNTVHISAECADELWDLTKQGHCSKCDKSYYGDKETSGAESNWACYRKGHQKYVTYDSGAIWYCRDEVTYKDKLSFNSDHAEHMDYLANEYGQKIIAVLNKHQVRGDICFGSLEGDNAGCFWGYRFDGKGNMKELTGKIVWS